MRRVFMVMALLVAATVFAQQTQQSTQTQPASPKVNLGELAKKEKARRENLEKKGKTARVYTKDDISKINARLGIESSSSDESPTFGINPGSDNATAVIEDAADMARRQTEEIIANYKSQLADLIEQRDEVQKKLDSQKGNLSAGGPYTVNPATAINNINDLTPTLQDLNNQIQQLQQQIDMLSNQSDAPH